VHCLRAGTPVQGAGYAWDRTRVTQPSSPDGALCVNAAFVQFRTRRLDILKGALNSLVRVPARISTGSLGEEHPLRHAAAGRASAVPPVGWDDNARRRCCGDILSVPCTSTSALTTTWIVYVKPHLHWYTHEALCWKASGVARECPPRHPPGPP